MKTVEHVAHLHLVLIGKNLASVEILICRDLVLGHEAHDYAEHVFLPVDRVFREIEGSVLVFFKVDLAVNHAHPLHIGVADRAAVGIVEILHAVGHAGLRLCVTFGTGLAATHSGVRALVLGRTVERYGCQKQCRKCISGYKFHIAGFLVFSLQSLPWARGRG